MTNKLHSVVHNDEGQYSTWPTDREPPSGWHRSGVTGSLDDCLDHIEKVWTDLRPASLRAATEQAGDRG